MFKRKQSNIDKVLFGITYGENHKYKIAVDNENKVQNHNAKIYGANFNFVPNHPKIQEDSNKKQEATQVQINNSVSLPNDSIKTKNTISDIESFEEKLKKINLASTQPEHSFDVFTQNQSDVYNLEQMISTPTAQEVEIEDIKNAVLSKINFTKNDTEEKTAKPSIEEIIKTFNAKHETKEPSTQKSFQINKIITQVNLPNQETLTQVSRKNPYQYIKALEEAKIKQSQESSLTLTKTNFLQSTPKITPINQTGTINPTLFDLRQKLKKEFSTSNLLKSNLSESAKNLQKKATKTIQEGAKVALQIEEIKNEYQNYLKQKELKNEKKQQEEETLQSMLKQKQNAIQKQEEEYSHQKAKTIINNSFHFFNPENKIKRSFSKIEKWLLKDDGK